MADSPPVLLLHGLGRTARSTSLLARRLRHAGFDPRAVGYPSTCHPIAKLADEWVHPAVEAVGGGPVHVVTHSLGGILIRVYAKRHGLPEGSRIVMVAPPNAGNELADLLHNRWPFTRLCGPALSELCTDGITTHLGLVDAEVGIIAGDRNVYPGLGRLIGTPSDGRVSVESTKLDGMTDFTVVRAGHAFIMRNRTVADETIHFLREGRFYTSLLRNETATEAFPG